MSGRDLALRSPRVVRKCPIQFEGVFAEYLEDLRLRSYRERTVEDHRLNILKVLKEFDASGVKTLPISYLRTYTIYLMEFIAKQLLFNITAISPFSF